jgi:hypothetical protein
MQFSNLGRREFITLLGGAAAAWPLATRAQQAKVFRIGFIGLSAADPHIFATHSLRRTKANLIYRRTGNRKHGPVSRHRGR